jgi:hypothetical protein
MVLVKWDNDKSKQITINGEGGNATLHFTKGTTIKIPDILWPDVKHEMAEDILNLHLIVIDSISDPKPVKKSKPKKKKSRNIKFKFPNYGETE